MKLFLRLLKLARSSRTAIIVSILISSLGGILGVFQARGVSAAIDRVFLQGKGFPAVSGILLVTLVIVLFRAVFSWGGEICSASAASRIKYTLRARFYSHLSAIGPAYLKGEAGESEATTGDLVNTATEGFDALELYYSQYLPQIALAVLVPLSILIFVFQADFLSGMVLLVTAPLLPAFMYLIGTYAESLTRKQWRGLSRMSAYFLDILQGLETLKSLGRSRDQVEGIKKVSEQYRRGTMDVLRVTFLSALVLELIATISTAVVAVEIGIRLLYGRLAFEQAFFVLLLAPEFYQPLRLLGTRFHTGMAGRVASRSIFKLLDIPTAENKHLDGINETISSTNTAPPSIIFDQVSYEYSNQHQALKDVSFEIQPGTTTALIGESGAGKTTLTWILMHFLQPKSGDIYVNSRSLAGISAGEWRNQLTWVSQQPYLFNDTVAANIKIARPEADDAAMYTAAGLAHADEFVRQMPQGYATLIGERGTRLSTGQAQRIALARAFLKDAPLLILDEATSHLDPAMDLQLQESIRQLTPGRTVLMIAHHRSTLSRVDQVVELSHGRVVKVQAVASSAILDPVLPGKDLHNEVPRIPSSKSELSSGEQAGDIQAPKQPALERRLIKLLSPYAGRIALSVILGCATILSSVGLMATAAYIISAAALHPSIADLQVAIVGVRFFGLSRGIFRYLERLVSHDVTFRLLARWRAWFYQALEPLAPARLRQYHSGDLLSRIIADIGSLEGFYVRSIAPPLVALLVSVAVCAFLGSYSSAFGWTLLGFLALAGFALPLIIQVPLRQLGPQIFQVRAHLSALLVDGIQGLPDLLTCSKAGIQDERLRQAGERLASLQGHQTRLTAAQNALGSLLSSLGMLAVLTLAIHQVASGQLNGVLLGVLALGALVSFEAAQPLSAAAQNLQLSRASARRLYELVDAAPPVIDPPEPLRMPQDTRLDVRNLTFQYPPWVDESTISSASTFKLEDISFFLAQGKHIAIVGPSGSGKTTMINILQRFWDYQQGEIQLGGNDLHRYHQEEVRRNLGIVSQNTYLFSATLKDNLLIARPDASQEEIMAAVKAASLDKLIQSLPGGYGTWVGEHGMHLSAGERQRLALARQFLKNAPVLILDEPTANLDPATEKAVLEAIDRFSVKRSTISITQHMMGLDKMDEILVIYDGRILEHGSHGDLLSQHGLYHRMWQLYSQII